MHASDRNIILVGGGHAHLHVLNQAAKFRQVGAPLFLVDPGDFWYSGMATGMLGGRYRPEEDRVDLAAFCRKRDVTFLRERMVGIDLKNRILLTDTERQLPFELLSLNIGSEIQPGAFDDPENLAWPVKPISRIPEIQKQLMRLSRRESPSRVVVIGGGPTGCEIAANVRALFRARNQPVRVALMVRGDRPLPEAPPGASRILGEVFRKWGIEVLTNSPVISLQSSPEGVEIKRDEKASESADLVISATGLAAPLLLSKLGLGNQGLEVDACLNSLADPALFGAGDCIDFQPRALPKVGVYGVRQGPILLHNLLARWKREELKPFCPQSEYLTLLNLGNGRALASRGRYYYYGRMAFLLKNFLDRRFMRKWKSL